MTEIVYLADHPEFLETVARWHLEAFGEYQPRGMDLASKVGLMKGRMNKERLPILWVALDSGQPVGTVQLKPQEVPALATLTPWVGGLYVDPGHRSKGLGARLVAAAEEAARTLACDRVYLITTDRADYYARLGYQRLQTIPFKGTPTEVMGKEL